MNQDVRNSPPWSKNDTPAPDADAPAEPGPPAATEAAPGAGESTVGTGSVIALGCIGGTLVLILFGLLFIGLNALF